VVGGGRVRRRRDEEGDDMGRNTGRYTGRYFLPTNYHSVYLSFYSLLLSLRNNIIPFR
jgi:hypothetical protein